MKIYGLSGIGHNFESLIRKVFDRSNRGFFRACMVFGVFVLGCAHTSAEPIERGPTGPDVAGETEKGSVEASGLQGPAPRVSKETGLGFPCPM